MADAYNKFDAFVGDLANGVHDLAAHSLKVMLSNTLPVRTNAVKADITEIAAGNGYAAGGVALTSVTDTDSSGTVTLSAANAVFTASGGSIGPFQYAVLYNDTPTSPLKPLIGWWTRSAGAVTLADGETFTVDLTGHIFTLA